MRHRILAVFLIVLLIFIGGASAVSYFDTIEEGYENIETQWGPYIGQLARLTNMGYELLDKDFNDSDLALWFEIYGYDVDQIKARDEYLKQSDYDNVLVEQVLYETLSENSYVLSDSIDAQEFVNSYETLLDCVNK